MKLQTGVSSKDLSILKELAELEKHQEALKMKIQNDEKIEAKSEEKDQEEENQQTFIFEKIKTYSYSLAKTKWENCCLKPENCCVVKAVRKLAN